MDRSVQGGARAELSSLSNFRHDRASDGAVAETPALAAQRRGTIRVPGLARALVAVSAVALTLGLLEIVLARYLPQRTVTQVLGDHAAMYRPGAVVPFELIPGFRGREREHEGEFDVAVEINGAGFRQADEVGPKRAGGTRMVAIGDSFTFGEGVEGEEAWPRALHAALGRSAARPTEVINAGVPGRWMDDYYLELKNRVLALDPDVVLLGFFVGNDIDGEDARAHVWSRVDSHGLPEEVEVPDLRVENGHRLKGHVKSRWRLPIVRDSHVAQLFFDGGKAVFEALWPPELAEEITYAPVDTAETKEIVGRVERLLLAMVELCRARGCELVAVMIPTREQVSPELAPSGRERDWEKPQRHFRAFFERAGIPFVDLLPAVRAAKDEAPLYYRFDAHWTARGHALAAENVAAFLKARNLADPLARP